MRRFRPATPRGPVARLRFAAAVLAVGLVAAFLIVHHIKGHERHAWRRRRPRAPSRRRRSKSSRSIRAAHPGADAAGRNPGLVHVRRSMRGSAAIVAKWIVDIGDRVKKDQVLATIDTPELDAQLEAAQAQLKASEAEVKVKEADADFAKTTYERWQGSPKGVVSDQEREDKKARYAVGDRRSSTRRAPGSALDQANVDRLTYLTRFKQVTAPYDGVITERRVDIGDLVTAGSTASTTLLYGMAQTGTDPRFANVPQARQRRTRRWAARRRSRRANIRTGSSRARSPGPASRSIRTHARCGSRSTCPTTTSRCFRACMCRSRSTSIRRFRAGSGQCPAVPGQRPAGGVDRRRSAW